MTDNTENLVLEILRQIRGDITSLRNEMRDGFNRVEIRLGYVEQSLASDLAVSASDREEVRNLRQRIERSLELQG
jgi:hypothetical protein